MEKQHRTKILYLITKSNWGGAQQYVFDLASELSPDEFDVVVALGGTGRLKDELSAKNIRTISLQNLERDISFFKEIQSTIELFKILKSEKPDILHINSSKAGGLGAFIGRILSVPKIIFTAHGWAFNEDRPWWQRVVIKKLHWITILLSHVTITVSETTRRQMDWPFVQQKMRVIHNGRTLRTLHDRSTAREVIRGYAPLEKYKDDFWSVTIGELHPIKQHDVTIRTFANIVKEYPQARHIIIGEGDDRLRLEKLIHKHKLEENIFLTGNIPEASQYLQAFDLFVLSSRSEALAYVIIEACSAGLPIISSNVGGIPEIITQQKNGFLFEQGSTLLLSQYYKQLYSSAELRKTLSENALLRAQDFTFEKMSEGTVALYVNL